MGASHVLLALINGKRRGPSQHIITAASIGYFSLGPLLNTLSGLSKPTHPGYTGSLPLQFLRQGHEPEALLPTSIFLHTSSTESVDVNDDQKSSFCSHRL